MRAITCKRGDVIVVEGQRGADAYLVESGRVEVYRAGPPELPLAVLGPGQIFGEMALITEQPRSASVRAIDDVQLQVMGWDEFLERLHNAGDGLLPLLRTLSERLRNMNALIEDLSRRSPSVREAIRVHLGADAPFVDATAAAPSRIHISIEGLTSPATAALRGRTATVDRFPFRIGRQTSPGDPFSSNELAIPDGAPAWVSRNHCMLVDVDGRCFLVDRGSRLGTLVDGKMVGGEKQSGRIELHDGDHEVRIGGALTPFRFGLNVKRATSATPPARRAENGAARVREGATSPKARAPRTREGAGRSRAPKSS